MITMEQMDELEKKHPDAASLMRSFWLTNEYRSLKKEEKYADTKRQSWIESRLTYLETVVPDLCN